MVSVESGGEACEPDPTGMEAVERMTEAVDVVRTLAGLRLFVVEVLGCVVIWVVDVAFRRLLATTCELAVGSCVEMGEMAARVMVVLAFPFRGARGVRAELRGMEFIVWNAEGFSGVTDFGNRVEVQPQLQVLRVAQNDGQMGQMTAK